MDSSPTFFARVEEITPDIKPEWFHVKLLVLQIPLLVVTWILRQAYFNGEGRCATCHSPTGDLAGYGKRFPAIEIQQRFVFPNTTGGRGRGRAAGPSRQQVTVTVTLADGTSVSGPLVSIDDFHVALRDEAGAYRSWTRTPAIKVVKNDPLSAHVELLDRLTDKQMHDVVAYLETLK
jgi:hypothetical protein